MPRRSALAALAAALLFAAAAGVPAPRSARTVVPAGRPGADETVVRLLDRHGEPALAWEALRASGGARTEAGRRLAIGLLIQLGRFAEADSLVAMTAFDPTPRASVLRQLQRARLNLQAGRHSLALELLSTGVVEDPALAAYRDYLLARIYLALGDGPAAISCLDRARKADATEALRAPIDEQRVDIYTALGRPRDALAAANDAVRSAVDDGAKRRMMKTRYRLAWDCDDRVVALREARRLFDEHRNSSEAEACAIDLLGRESKDGLSSSTLLACAQVLAARGQTEALRRALRAVDAREPGGRESEEHRLLWADYHYQSRDYSRAIALARPSYSDPSLRRRSMLVMARSLRKLGRTTESAAVYEQFARDYPNDGLAAEALYAAASQLRQGGREDEAVRVLDQLRRSYPSSFHGWAAAMRRAGELSDAGSSEEAAAIYEQWLARSRRTDEAALFYLARERERAGAGSARMILDELRAVNPYSFYASPDVAQSARGPVRASTGVLLLEGPGSLTEWLAGADAERDEAYRRVLRAAAAGSAGGDRETARAIERGVMFLEAGLRDWAEQELDVARRRSGGSAEQTLTLARVYEEYAMPWRSVRLYERARSSLSWEDRREHRDDFRFLTHPLPYPAQVLESAGRNGLPAHLVYGVIREESRFEADVVSRAGAVGLMQLMPGTARQVAARLELGDLDGRLDDPSVNVTLGVWYAADLLREGKGSVVWMLAAYNAGPGAADRWLRPGVSGDPAIDAVESIDYKETRGYVKRVVESANVYHALYFGGTRAPANPR